MALKESKRGSMSRYPDGIVWITDRPAGRYIDQLPLPSFGDNEDHLSLSAKVSLKQHLLDVYAKTHDFTLQLGLPEFLTSTLTLAARLHDLGKAEPRFQAKLFGVPLSVAYMQRELLAKSETGSNGNPGDLPKNFRHEMLSLALVDHIDLANEVFDEDLLKHQIASHHGHARPFAPVSIDDSPANVNLASLGLGTISAAERRSWPPAHRLDSGVPERFWKMTRKYGWWGLAYLESIMRLADWDASATIGCGAGTLNLKVRESRPNLTSEASRYSLPLSGIDGSNPLGFLAALGAFLVVSTYHDDDITLHWERLRGAWRPVLKKFTIENGEDQLLDLLVESLRCSDAEHPALRLAESVDSNGARNVFRQACANASKENRKDADWLSCNGSDIVNADVISQLQTTRRDYHAINVRGLLSNTTRDHLRRSLFHPWDYSDPIAGVSLHLEPREDRRHAYQWHMPSGDPTRKSSGGMIGANRLALEAWPLFQSLPAGDKVTTVGFLGTRASNTRFFWPIWDRPISLSVLLSLLGYRGLKLQAEDPGNLKEIGIRVIYCCSRILVGKTPNLTSPIAVLA